MVIESFAVFHDVADTLYLNIFSSCSNSYNTSLYVLLPLLALGPILVDSGLNVIAGCCCVLVV